MSGLTIEQIQRSILNTVGIGRSGVMLPTVYDTAWLARIPAEYNATVPAFPQALNWIRQNQRSDGRSRRTQHDPTGADREETHRKHGGIGCNGHSFTKSILCVLYGG